MAGLNSTTLEQLAEFNQNSFHYRIPALVFLCLLLPIGIVGNASVIYIYGFRLKQSNVHLLITLLAVSDMISCLVGIPLKIYNMLVFYSYTSLVTCKVMGTFLCACYICSALILLVISVERYLKVCRSMGTQMSRKMAKILVGAAFFVSSLLAVPLPVFAVLQTVTLDNGTIVQMCSINTTVYAVGFDVFVFCIFVAMSFLYWRIIKTTQRQMIWTQQQRAQTNHPDIKEDTQQTMPVAKAKRLSQTNRAVIWISVVFFISCVPPLIIVKVTMFTNMKAGNNLSYIVFLVGRFWIFNCTLNPVVYGFLNSKFRTELRNIFHLNFTETNVSSVGMSEEQNKTSSIETP